MQTISIKARADPSLLSWALFPSRVTAHDGRILPGYRHFDGHFPGSRSLSEHWFRRFWSWRGEWIECREGEEQEEFLQGESEKHVICNKVVMSDRSLSSYPR